MIRIHKLEKKDKALIDKTKSFIKGIIKDDFGYEINPLWHEDFLKLEKYYLNPRSCFYVLINSGEIIGTIAARPYDKKYEYFKNKYNSVNTLSIWRHYINKDLRSKGFGSKLLSKVLLFANKKDYQYLYLHTQKTIKGSLEYWLAKGFKATEDVGDEFYTVHMEKVII